LVTEIKIIEIEVQSGFLNNAFFGRKNLENNVSHILTDFMGKDPVNGLSKSFVRFILATFVRPLWPFKVVK
jgi:hypothetical protein